MLIRVSPLEADYSLFARMFSSAEACPRQLKIIVCFISLGTRFALRVESPKGVQGFSLAKWGDEGFPLKFCVDNNRFKVRIVLYANWTKEPC
jgi:hypothetical protein